MLADIYWTVMACVLLWVINDCMAEQRQWKASADRLQAEADKRHWDAVFARIEGRVTDEGEG
jgi:hypothetical protein